jgi:uncharacterized metal-binding protein YceD (DUF177 family)
MKNELSRPVAIETIDSKGYKTTITATEDECADLAKRFDLNTIDSLRADITITPHTATYHVTGELTAEVEQISVISGDPVPTTIKQDIEAWFTDGAKIASFEQAKQRREKTDEEHEIVDEKDDPERIMDGAIDLGEVTAQFLGLALDDFPRGQDEENGDYIEVDEKDAKSNPFAALEALKDKK